MLRFETDLPFPKWPEHQKQGLTPNPSPPALIIEVLSPSTRQYDLDEKLNAYLQIASLEYYIILEQHMPLAIVMRRTPHGFLRELYEGVDTTIHLPCLECTIELHEIYAGVEFTATCVQESELEYENS